jgi:glycosyltransferase involved in cell wall biosynthesis
MKIAFIPSTFLPWVGGAEIQTHNTANKLEELNHKVDIFLLKKEIIKNKKYKIITFNKFLINSIFLLKYYFYLDFTYVLQRYFKIILKKKKYDVWHFHSLNYKTLMYVRPLKNLQQKVHITFQGADIQKDFKIKYGYRFDCKYENFLKREINLFDKIYSISDNITKELSFFNVHKENIIKVPNSIEIKKIKYVGNSKKANFNNRLMIITVARFYEKKKGLDLIPKIGEYLIKKNVDFNWTLIGRGSENLLKNSFIKKNNKYFSIHKEINNKNETYFPHSDLIKLYKKHNVYINLARIESFGITIIEAIAAGLPIFTFNTKGANEIVKDKINGFIVKKYHSLDMANLIWKMIKNNYFNKPNKNINHINIYDLKLNTKILVKNYSL